MKRLASVFILLLFAFPARAFEQAVGNTTFRFDGIINAGTDGFDDFLLRAQISYRFQNQWNMGAVYAMDGLALNAKQAAKDAFLFLETNYGRAEGGWTQSIASKLALVLPDVGGTRLNNSALFYHRDFKGITTPIVYGNQYAWRFNLVTPPGYSWQAGLGQTVHAASFDSSTDLGIRYRYPTGRIKTSVSLGASYINHPHGMIGDNFLPPVTATARYQGTIGFNLQYGSLVWAATAKSVFDEKPAGEISDGMQLGTGLSYDFLSWSASAGYIFSDIGAWRDIENIYAHTGIVSIRCKLNKYFNVWGSAGITGMNSETGWFAVAGTGLKF